MDIWKTWNYNINYREQNITTFLELSAAFDCVEHNTLIDKIKLYGFDTTMTNIIISYLSLRS